MMGRPGYPPEYRKLVARQFLDTDLTLQQVGDMYGVSAVTVRTWAKQEDSETYKRACHKRNSLLMAQEIMEAQPNIRAEELALMVGVHRATVDIWNKVGKIELDTVCALCGESVETKYKYCKECVEKKYDYYHRTYGLTYEEIKALPTKCEVCGSTENLHVDHDHSTGKYRGVLCHFCNVGLGMMGDSIDRLKNMIEYLKRNQEKEKETIK